MRHRISTLTMRCRLFVFHWHQNRLEVLSTLALFTISAIPTFPQLKHLADLLKGLDVYRVVWACGD